MKILFLTPWYPDDRNPNHGIFVRDQVIALSESHEIIVVTSKIDYTTFAISSSKTESKINGGITERHIKVCQSLPIYNQLNYFLITIYKTWRIGRKFKPDIIHTNIGYPGAFWGWAISVLLRVPYVVTEHTRITNNFRSGFHKFLALFGLKRAAIVIAVSQWQANEIAAAIHKEVSVVANIIDFKKFSGIQPQSPGFPVQIGFLGGLDTPVKGLDNLLNAIAGIRQDYVLNIGGKGKLLPQYQSLAEKLGIKGKCIFHGFVEHSKVPAFMEQLHFFVSASRHETFGMVMAEAMACGLPVVATDSGGSRDLITTDNGLLAVNNDATALQTVLERMMKSYQEYSPESVAASVEKFSATEFKKKMEVVYSKVIESHG